MAVSMLELINSPEDLRKLPVERLAGLAAELRKFIIDVVAAEEGHLGSSLGVVELTIALHYVFDTPNDILVWDVGHQAYGHKILTGRRTNFRTNRKLHGISGFPKREESVYDAFGTGHSSTAISAVLGMAVAARQQGLKRQHIAVVGDASIAAGMAFEALNHAGVTDTDILVILNDNTIGIDPSVGALKEYLIEKSLSREPSEGNLFEALRFSYSGPIDGHNIIQLIAELNRLKSIKGPKLLHIITKKGKGYLYAEEDQIQYHAPGKFDVITGKIASREKTKKTDKFQDVFGLTLVELAEINPKIVGITPAMPTGSSMRFLMERFPERAFDVGIAEQHAVTFAAGLAAGGLTVFCAVYSTFLQRAYDQLIHDVCLQKLPVVFCVDRAGIVGEDGATHHGIFDLAFLRCIPNLIVCAPRNEMELRHIMYTAQCGLSLPIAIRYPRGYGRVENWKQPFVSLPIGTGACIKEGEKLAFLTVGTVVNNVLDALEEVDEVAAVAVYDLRFVKPLDEQLLRNVFLKYPIVVTVEDGVVAGGFGSAVTEFATTHHFTNSIYRLGVPDAFPTHGSIEELQDLCGYSTRKIVAFIRDILL